MNQTLRPMNDSTLVDSTLKVLTTLRRVDLALLEHLSEIEARELHLKLGYSSLFKMCTDKFRLSEASAYRRVAASRLIRKYPSVKMQLVAGDVSMCTLAMVAGKMDELPSDAARTEILAAINGKSKSQVEELLVQRVENATTKKRDVIRPMRAAQHPLALKIGSSGLQPARVDSEPLSPEMSYRIAFSASTDFRKKLEKARDLLKHKHPDGNLEAVLEAALDHLLKSRDLVQRKSRKVCTPPANPRYIPSSVKRHVMARDGGRCTFTSAEGHRCRETGGLEFEHKVPFARGGSSTDGENIEILCRNHNAWRARQNFEKSRQFSGLN